MAMTTLPSNPEPLRVRRAGAGDLSGVDELCRRQTPEGLRLRFFSPAPRLTTGTFRRLTTQRPGEQVALLALDGDRVAGLARYDRRPCSDEAFAWLLADRTPEPAVDILLLTGLVEEARRSGIRRLTLEVHPLHQDLLRALAGSPLRTSRHLHSGMVTVAIDTADGGDSGDDSGDKDEGH